MNQQHKRKRKKAPKEAKARQSLSSELAELERGGAKGELRVRDKARSLDMLLRIRQLRHVAISNDFWLSVHHCQWQSVDVGSVLVLLLAACSAHMICIGL